MALIVGVGAITCAAVVGGVAAGTAIHSKTQRDKARKIMVDCGPYFLNEGITVQDLWTDFERRIKGAGRKRSQVIHLNAQRFQDVCRELGYSETQSYLLLRTWKEGNRSTEILKQPYLRAMNNSRYETRACPAIQEFCQQRNGTQTSESAGTIVTGHPISSHEDIVCSADGRPGGPVPMPRVHYPASAGCGVTPGGPTAEELASAQPASHHYEDDWGQPVPATFSQPPASARGPPPSRAMAPPTRAATSSSRAGGAAAAAPRTSSYGGAAAAAVPEADEW